jgi:nitroreductase
MEEILSSAAAAPDHGLLMPWRIICIGDDQRAALAKAFILALLERDPGATLAQLESAREKAFRAPFLALVVFKPGPESAGIRVIEQVISTGCAIQNILLTAHAMGFGSGLSSGRAMTSEPIRSLFELGPNEEAACFISIGTVTNPRPIRHRSDIRSFVSYLKVTALVSTSLS